MLKRKMKTDIQERLKETKEKLAEMRQARNSLSQMLSASRRECHKYKTALEQIKHVGDVQIRPPNYAGHEHLDKECGHIACITARALTGKSETA